MLDLEIHIDWSDKAEAWEAWVWNITDGSLKTLITTPNRRDAVRATIDFLEEEEES